MPPEAVRIIAEVELESGVSLEEMRDIGRLKRVVKAREAVVLRLREHRRFSYPQIGKMLNKVHSSVIAAYRRGGGTDWSSRPTAERVRAEIAK